MIGLLQVGKIEFGFQGIVVEFGGDFEHFEFDKSIESSDEMIGLSGDGACR